MTKRKAVRPRRVAKRKAQPGLISQYNALINEQRRMNVSIQKLTSEFEDVANKMTTRARKIIDLIIKEFGLDITYFMSHEIPAFDFFSEIVEIADLSISIDFEDDHDYLGNCVIDRLIDFLSEFPIDFLDMSDKNIINEINDCFPGVKEQIKLCNDKFSVASSIRSQALKKLTPAERKALNIRL